MNINGRDEHGNVEDDEAQEMTSVRQTKLGATSGTKEALLKSFHSSAVLGGSVRKAQAALTQNLSGSSASMAVATALRADRCPLESTNVREMFNILSGMTSGSDGALLDSDHPQQPVLVNTLACPPLKLSRAETDRVLRRREIGMRAMTEHIRLPVPPYRQQGLPRPKTRQNLVQGFAGARDEAQKKLARRKGPRNKMRGVIVVKNASQEFSSKVARLSEIQADPSATEEEKRSALQTTTTAMETVDIISPLNLSMRDNEGEGPRKGAKSDFLTELAAGLVQGDDEDTRSNLNNSNNVCTYDENHSSHLRFHPFLSFSPPLLPTCSDVNPALLVTAVDLSNCVHSPVNDMFAFNIETHAKHVVRTALSSALRTGRTRGLVRLELHIDDPCRVPRQKLETQESRDVGRTGVMSVQLRRERGDSHGDEICSRANPDVGEPYRTDSDTRFSVSDAAQVQHGPSFELIGVHVDEGGVLDLTQAVSSEWSSEVLRHRIRKRQFANSVLALGLIHVLETFSDEGVDRSETVLTVHGGGLAFSEKATSRICATDLMVTIQKTTGIAVVHCHGEDVSSISVVPDPPPFRAKREVGRAFSCGDCCWRGYCLKVQGNMMACIERYPAMECCHGESKTRMQWTLGNFPPGSSDRSASAEDEPHPRPEAEDSETMKKAKMTLLQVSKDTDNVFLALCALDGGSFDAYDNIYVRMGSKMIDIRNFHSALLVAGVGSAEITRLYGFGGFNFNAACLTATNKKMVRTFLAMKEEIGDLATTESALRLYYLTYLHAMSGCSSLDKMPEPMRSTEFMTPRWMFATRRYVAFHANTKTLAGFIPQDADIEQAFKRVSVFVCQWYWSRAAQMRYLIELPCNES